MGEDIYPWPSHLRVFMPSSLAAGLFYRALAKRGSITYLAECQGSTLPHILHFFDS